MGLAEYEKKRNFARSPEPPGKGKRSDKSLRFVVQKHAASHLHYDFRLELDGVLKSWAIPKGPSLDPSIKRLAMQVEDHPFEYKDFEGVIPKGNYGAGEVIIWDEGTYGSAHPEEGNKDTETIREGFARGDLKFILNGQKLKGEFALVKIKADTAKTAKDNAWLLLKKHDEFATSDDITLENHSVFSNRTLDDIRTGKTHENTSSGKGNDTGKTAASDPMPHDLTPMLATAVSEPFDDPDWIFEIKLDGYRSIAEIENGKVTLYSRNNISFNQKFSSILQTLETIKNSVILDGEMVVLNDKGISDFQLLQNYLTTGKGTISYFVFDLLYLDGKDLRSLPLAKRKKMLRDLLPELPDIRYSDHLFEFGKSFFELAKENNLEGIIAKHGNSRYYAGKRSREWLKIKIKLQQEAVICGFSEPRGSRKYFGALVLGVYEKGELVHIGMSGGGFGQQSLKEIYGKLQPLVQKSSPFSKKIGIDTRVQWVHPVLVCEVSFTEWTDEKIMRHPVFLGLREDKDPRSVVREIFAGESKHKETESENGGEKSPETVAAKEDKIPLTNLNKIFWPEEKYTKGDVIDYYRKISDLILPYLKDRPESLYRTPNGISEKGFYQKETGELQLDLIERRKIFSKSNNKDINYYLCQNKTALLYMANLGCIEIHPWFSRIQHLEYPDFLVIDLDPEDISFDKVVEAALVVNEVLHKAGARSFPKTSGATGLHICVPLAARYDYETAGNFARLIATIVHNQIPAFTSIVRSPAKRQKKVYLDFLQNKAGQTIAAPYSIRARPGAPISTPLAWEEVKPGLDPDSFTIRTIHSRIEKKGDLFNGILGEGIDIEKCIIKLEKG